MNTTYSVESAFERLENDLVNDIIKQIKTKKTFDDMLPEDYADWKTAQLNALQDFKKRNKAYFTKDTKKALYDAIEKEIMEQYKKGASDSQNKIFKAIKRGMNPSKSPKNITAVFSGVNDRKLNALIKETQKNLYKAEYSAIRYSEDQYRKIIFDSNIYMQTGSYTPRQAIDMATKDFLSQGINCIEYKNGARVDIQAYSEMALRTSNKRSYMQGEAAMRDEWGEGLVIVTRRATACPKCMRFVGKVFNDDVYGNVPINPKYPLLSEAIAQGLYHPNCKDTHTTYFEEITTEYPEPTAKEQEEANRVYNLQQQQRYNERQIRKYKRLLDGSTDPENVKKYEDKVKQWQKVQRDFIDKNDDVLRRNYGREQIVGNDFLNKEKNETFTSTLNKINTPILKPNSDFNVSINLKNIPDDVKDIQEKQLNHLFNKYGAGTEKLKIYTDGRMTSADAFYRHGIGKGALKEFNEIKLSTTNKKIFIKDENGQYRSVMVGFNQPLADLVETEKIETKVNYFTKVDDINFDKATITHEYGHFIERLILDDEIENGTIKTVADYHNRCDDIQREIMQLYNKRTGKNAIDVMGDYGKSNSREFFAEAFKSYDLYRDFELSPEIETILKKYKILGD